MSPYSGPYSDGYPLPNDGSALRVAAANYTSVIDLIRRENSQPRFVSVQRSTAQTSTLAKAAFRIPSQILRSSSADGRSSVRIVETFLGIIP